MAIQLALSEVHDMFDIAGISKSLCRVMFEDVNAVIRKGPHIAYHKIIDGAILFETYMTMVKSDYTHKYTHVIDWSGNIIVSTTKGTLCDFEEGEELIYKRFIVFHQYGLTIEKEYNGVNCMSIDIEDW